MTTNCSSFLRFGLSLAVTTFTLKYHLKSFLRSTNPPTPPHSRRAMMDFKSNFSSSHKPTVRVFKRGPQLALLFWRARCWKCVCAAPSVRRFAISLSPRFLRRQTAAVRRRATSTSQPPTQTHHSLYAGEQYRRDALSRRFDSVMDV